ncbi:MAG: hypothetical protein SGPRY_008980 [Prymnesium sp.]
MLSSPSSTLRSSYSPPRPISRLRSGSSTDLVALSDAVRRLEQRDAQRGNGRAQMDQLRSHLEDHHHALEALNERVNDIADGGGNEALGRQRYDDVRAELEKALSEIGSIRSNATATAAALPRMEEVVREAGVVKQEVGLLRGEMIEIERVLREADARATELASSMSALSHSASNGEARYTALIATTAEAHTRLGRELSELKSELRKGAEASEVKMQEGRDMAAAIAADVKRGDERVAQLEEHVGQQVSGLTSAHQGCASSLEELAHRMQQLAERFDRAEGESIRRWEEMERKVSANLLTITSLRSAVDAAHGEMDGLRSTIRGWDLVFATVGALESSEQSPTVLPEQTDRGFTFQTDRGFTGLPYQGDRNFSLPSHAMSYHPLYGSPPASQAVNSHLSGGPSAAVGCGGASLSESSREVPFKLDGKAVSEAELKILRQMRASMRLQDMQPPSTNVPSSSTPQLPPKGDLSSESVPRHDQPLRQNALQERFTALQHQSGGLAESRGSALEQVQRWLASGKVSELPSHMNVSQSSSPAI